MPGIIVFNENQQLTTETLLPSPTNIALTSVTQTYTSVSQNLSVESRSRGVQRWEVDITWPPLAQKDAMKVYSFLIRQQGTFGVFKIALPHPLSSSAGGTQSDNIGLEGTPMVTDDRSIVSTSVEVGNFNKGQDVALTAGSFFTFSNHDKLYMVTSDLKTNSAGQGILNFTPPVLSKLAPGSSPGGSVFAGGTEIIHRDMQISVSLKTDQFEVPIDENVHYSLSATLGERVSIANL